MGGARKVGLWARQEVTSPVLWVRRTQVPHPDPDPTPTLTVTLPGADPLPAYVGGIGGKGRGREGKILPLRLTVFSWA